MWFSVKTSLRWCAKDKYDHRGRHAYLYRKSCTQEKAIHDAAGKAKVMKGTNTHKLQIQKLVYRVELSFDSIAPKDIKAAVAANPPEARIVASEEEGYPYTILTTPNLHYEEMDVVVRLWRNLAERGAKGCGMRLFVQLKNNRRAVANLGALMESKGRLIAKALRIIWSADKYEPRLPDQGGMVEVFPFAVALDLDENELKACMQLGLGIANQVQSQTRMTPRLFETNNERYAFRCWMLHMGLIGDEFKSCRRFFLSRLEGTSSRK